MRIVALLILAVLTSLAAGNSADLLEAAKKGKIAQLEQLLAKGADLESADRDGRTPLMLAAQYGHAPTVRLLLDKGAKSAARDTRGWTAYMLALLSPSGGVVHTPHDTVLKLLPQPKRFRIAIDASWAPGKELFSSCFMRPSDLTQHLRQLRPDGMVIEALQRFAQASGRDLMVIVSADARGTSDISGKTTPADIDATLTLQVEPGITCVQQSDQVSMLIHATLAPQNSKGGFERVFGAGMKTGMRGQLATNANQHGPLFETWAKSQAGPVWWAVLTALLTD
ncbi:MAG: Ankyrin [Candidatus Solibacter sp.]|nr:Ankyrin [Candidatus Solibacter sp.]